jgi:hypothetical protein
VVHQINRDTIINEDNKSNEVLYASPSSPSTKNTPTANSPSLPVRNHGNGDIPSSPSSNGKARKQNEQTSNLPPRVPRAIPTTGKIPSPSKAQKNLPINKENLPVATAASEPGSPSCESQPIQRHKSRNLRRKMTEEEAIKELGSFIDILILQIILIIL